MARMDGNALHGLLGEFYDELDDDQRQVIVDAAEAIGARWPDPDDDEERRIALNAALAMVYGDDTAAAAAADWLAARTAEVSARARLTGAIITTRLKDPAVFETDLADQLGISRLMVRKALGKDRRPR